MNSDKVYKGVRSMFHNHDHKFENVYIYDWECDHFSVTGSGYAYEIEVKVSKSDFKADFQKPKHHFFKHIKNGYSIVNKGRGSFWIKDELIEHSNIEPKQISFKNCPNVFYFACPVGLIEAHEIPKYAGLIYVMDNGEARVVKKAPYIHKDKVDPSKILFSKYMYGFINMKIEMSEMKRDLKWWKDRYENTQTEKGQLIYF